MEFPATLVEFMEQFPDEDACRAYLEEMRWPNGFVCPRCEGTDFSSITSRRLRQCTTCRYQVSVTAGTAFHATQTSLRKWFLAIFFLARHKQGISALQLQRDLGLGSYQTAWTMLHKLRSGLGRRTGELLKGAVETDETFVGGSRSGGKRGRGAPNKSIVVVMVEQLEHSAGSAVLETIPDASWKSLGPAVRGAIEEAKTTVMTDDWSGYWPLAAAGVDHEATTLGSPEAAGEVLPWAHTIISNLKAWLVGTFHGVSHKHLDGYLREFTYRLNRRWTEDKLFYYLTRRAVEGSPLPYHRLTAEPIG
ncbi:MAG: IS1595 family transposase [bacterium]|nr:IS1595 family transposase [bacterium]